MVMTIKRFYLSLFVVLCALVLLWPLNAQEQFANFPVSTLATAIDNDDTSVVVATGEGSKFPTCCTGSQDFYVVLQTGSTQEIVRVTNRSSDTLTVVRAQDGTSAASFGVGSRVEQRIVRATLNRLRDLTNSNVTPVDDSVLLGDSTPKWVTAAVPDCDNATTSKLLYDTTTNAFSCGSDQGGSGASLTRINSSSGAAGSDFTFQKLSSNCTANSTTTLATCMTTTSVGSGTWTFTYNIFYQSGATTTGVDFAVNHTGTVTKMVLTTMYATSGGTAANATALQNTTNTANLLEGKGQRTVNTKTGANLGVDAANSNMHYIIEGIIVISASGSLELKHASEVAASSQVMAETSLELRKIG